MLSELEIATLGVLSLYQPCSGYKIRKVFERSLSSHWRGSAGAIYPVLKRLLAAKLVRATVRADDGRDTRSYQLSRKGKSELIAWLRPPIADARDLVTMDPLRVRVRFMQILPRTERLQLVREARTRLKEHVEEITALARADKSHGDVFRYLSHRNAILGMRAQLSWLDEVEALV